MRYRILVEGSRDLIFTVSPDGIITSLNPAFEMITGWKRDEWLGRNFKPLVHPEDLPYAEENYKRFFNGKTLPSSIILRILSKSGENVMLEVSIVPQIQDGKVVNGLGIARNITERRRIDEKIQEEERKCLLKDIRNQQHTLFEQFDSGISRKYEGTGLGFSITKHLVELHGGKITVKSRYGSGSTFSYLPPLDGKK